MNKEVIVCKFDNEIECDFYLCEEDCSDLEMYEEVGKSCPLFDKSEKLDVAIYRANKILSDINIVWGAEIPVNNKKFDFLLAQLGTCLSGKPMEET
jgi:hypothetical protein